MRIELKPRVMAGDVRAMGPGKADLLELIIETGSISAAARRMNMSYRRAWLLVDAMNGAFKKPLVTTETGGSGGGGATVTGLGVEVLAHYRRMQAALDAAASAYYGDFAKRLK